MVPPTRVAQVRAHVSVARALHRDGAPILVISAPPTMPAPGYRATLKALEVEEIIDLLVHRPLAHLLVLAVKGTPVTPDQLTIVSMLVGVAAGVATASSFVTGRSYLFLGGLLLVLSAVIDCSDGQLARLRKTSSTFGRMLDGAVDGVVQIAVIPAALLHVWWRHGGDTPGAPSPGLTHPFLGGWLSPTGWLVLGIAAILTGLAHTTLYDYFKNVYLRMTVDGKREGDEDPEEVAAAYAEARAKGATLLDRIRYEMYLGHVTNQRALTRAIDPHIPARFRDMPAYSDAAAQRYRDDQRGLMRAWSFYGIGTHIFGIGLCMALDAVEVYILARFFLANGALLVIVPLQRRASRRFFAPDSVEDDDAVQEALS